MQFRNQIPKLHNFNCKQNRFFVCQNTQTNHQTADKTGLQIADVVEKREEVSCFPFNIYVISELNSEITYFYGKLFTTRN